MSLSSIALDGAQHLNISYPSQGPLGADIFFDHVIRGSFYFDQTSICLRHFVPLRDMLSSIHSYLKIGPKFPMVGCRARCFTLHVLRHARPSTLQYQDTVAFSI